MICAVTLENPVLSSASGMLLTDGRSPVTAAPARQGHRHNVARRARLIHRAEVIDIDADSYRLKGAKEPTFVRSTYRSKQSAS
jgi:hypothetical protein